MTAAGTLQLPQAYACWQERLTRAFFDGRRGQPVVMFVDRAELQHLGSADEDASRSLAGAVRELVDVARGQSMFRRITVLQRQWLQGTRDLPPPTLPVLALSVLAASEMQSDGSGARHNYYVRLACALLPDALESDIESLRYTLGVRGGFRPVAGMWTVMDDWLKEQNGVFGISTIREHYELTRIGYPLSQTLIRRSDRAALTRFFARMHLPSDGVPSPSNLLTSIRLWTRNRLHGLSDGFVSSLEDPSLRDYVMAVVYELAKAWDGKIVTVDGKRRLEIRLTLDLDEASAWWSVPAVGHLSEDVLAGTCGGVAFEALLTSDAYSSMYAVTGLPRVTSAALTSGLRASGDNCVAEFQPAKLLALAGRADANGWLSVDAIQAYEEHVLVVAADIVPSVTQAVRTAADEGWRLLGTRFADELVGSAYSVFRGVIFSDKERLDRAVAALPGVVAKNLRLGAAVRPRLIEGLPVMQNIARHVYLAGGEPNLLLPGGDDPHLVMVTFDGSPQQLRASLFPLPLRRLPGISLGEHTVDVDGDELSFEVVQSAFDDRTPQGVGRLGWVNGQLRPDQGNAGICGAAVPSHANPRVVLARRNAQESWLIHRNGQLTELSVPQPPSFTEALNFLFFEVAEDSAAWLAQKRPSGWRVSRLNPGSPAFRTIDAASWLLWSRLAGSVTTPDELWHQYVRAWRQVSA